MAAAGVVENDCVRFSFRVRSFSISTAFVFLFECVRPDVPMSSAVAECSGAVVAKFGIFLVMAGVSDAESVSAMFQRWVANVSEGRRETENAAGFAMKPGGMWGLNLR
jgi:hypothetical protein